MTPVSTVGENYNSAREPLDSARAFAGSSTPLGRVEAMPRYRVTFISRDSKARIVVVETPSRGEALTKAGPAREGESVTVEEDE